MYGFLIYGSAVYGGVPTGTPIYSSYADLLAQTTVTPLGIADLIAQLSVASSQFHDLSSLVAIGTTSFKDLPAQTTVSVVGFQDLVGQLAVSTQTFKDLVAQVSVTFPTYVDLPSSVTLAPYGDLMAQVTIGREISTDFNSQVTISDYKWLSPTLYSAQQQPNVRYAFKTFIKDDSVSWSQNIGTFTFPIFGNSAMAPDGSLLVVGTASNGSGVDGNLWFKRIINPTDVTQWTTTGATQLVALGSWRSYDATDAYPLPPAISVSDWYQGTYVIDVYYWVYTGSPARYYIYQQRSLDGGKTWFSGMQYNTSLLGTASGLYMGLGAGKPIDNGVSGSHEQLGASVFFINSATNVPGSTDDTINFIYSPNVQLGSYNITAASQWSSNYIASGDWTLSGLDVFYQDNVYYVVFSGYHNKYGSSNTAVGNFGLYVTQVSAFNGDLSFNNGLVVWNREKSILVSGSTSTTNFAQFTLPRLSFDGTTLRLMFKGQIVQSVDENQNVTTTENYYLSESQDFVNYSYPLLLSDTNGNLFVDPNKGFGISTTSFQSMYGFIPYSSNLDNTAGYPQITNFCIIGNGGVWQYTQNNVMADLSDYVLSYDISESAGGPSSITINVGNANGQWVGISPTLPNYQAIKKNAKIYMFQGYYNVNGIPEYAPKNIFYIDDIQQKVTAVNNDLVITGRDFFKQFKTTISKFTFNYDGTDFIQDNFDGTTLGNWNVQNGGISWAEGTNPQTGGGAYTYAQTIFPASQVPASTNSGDVASLIALSGLNLTQSDWLLATCVQVPTSGQVEVYFSYIDNNNWLKLSLQASAPYGQIFQKINGVITTPFTSYNTTLGGYAWYPIWIRQYGWNVYDIYIGGALSTPSEYRKYNESNKAWGAIGFSGSTPTNSSFVQTIALGNNGAQAAFALLYMSQYRQSNSVQDLVESFGTQARIYDYWVRNIYEEYFNDSSKWTLSIPSGTSISLAGDRLALSGNTGLTNFAVAFYNNQQFTDAEIDFDMYVPQIDATYGADVRFIFRSQSLTSDSTAYICRLYSSSNKNLLVQFTATGGYVLAQSNLNGTNFDITKPHHYRVGFSQNVMYVFIDNVMVLSWRDDNNTYSSGYIGWETYLTNGATIYNVVSPQFFNQVRTFGFNPGDDIEDDLNNVIEIQRGWIASNLLGWVDLLILASTDPVDYYYGDNAQNFLLMDQEVDQSDKEYIDRVTVIGNNGIVATAQDNTQLGIAGILREQVVVDYQITTLQDAQNRANYELQNFNKFNTQPAPKLNNNVGSEIFDVVNVKDASNVNSSGYNSNVRVYNQEIVLNGQTNEYSITLGLGSV